MDIALRVRLILFDGQYREREIGIDFSLWPSLEAGQILEYHEVLANGEIAEAKNGTTSTNETESGVLSTSDTIK